MKKWLIGSFMLIIGVAASAQYVPPNSVATDDDIFSANRNPAGLAVNDGFQFGLATDPENFGDQYGIYLGAGQDHSAVAFGALYDGINYSYSYSNGARVIRGTYLGYGIDFGKGIAPEYKYGLITRPLNFLSVGASAMNFTENNGQQASYKAGIAIRPFGNRITLAADAVFTDFDADDEYSTDFVGQISTELINGISLNGFYDNASEMISLGVGINLPNQKVGSVSHLSSDGEYIRSIGTYQYTSASMRTLFDPVKADQFVLMRMNGPVVEEKPRFSIFDDTRGRTLTDFVMQLDKYSERKDLAGIVLYLENLTAGPAKYQEMRAAVKRFRESGKKVYVYMDTGGNSQYYLATAADKVFMNPAGSLWLTGFSAQLMYIKDLLGKVGIEAEFVHIGKYKSAGDMFTEDSTTEANREQLTAYLDDLYDTYTSDIAEARGLSQEAFKALVDDGPYTAKKALESGLVDSLLYHDELKQFITDENDNGDYSLITESSLNRKGKWKYDWEAPLSEKIAVVYAVGQIVTGKSQRSPLSGTVSMGSETIAKAIRKAREDNTVKAIILRIDSPGGSALASDIIWREVHLTVTGEKPKPVIVSMSDVAGSGGYYIAMAADTILADPGTITGSIGVIAGTFTMQELFDKIGVNLDIIKRGERSDFLSPSDSMTADEREKLYSLIEDTYQDFIGKAAEGRNMSVERIDSLGRGRIYSGYDAREVGLIDEVGGMKEAFNIAKESIGLSPDEEIAIEYYPKYSVDLFDLFNSTDIMTEYLQNHPALKQALSELDKAQILANQEALYLLPYTLKVK